jgi:Cu/Ag efflux pump CusA
VDLGPKANIFEARQRLMERLQGANLPPNVTPMLAPISFSEREVLLIGMRWKADLTTAEERTSDAMDLHTLAEHVVRDRLQSVPGVSQVVVTGGIRKQYQVVPDPERLRAFGVTLPQVVEALKKNDTVGAGGNLRRSGQEHPVPVRATSTSLQDLGATVVVVHDGVPVRIEDVARVRFGGSNRPGHAAIWTRKGAGAQDGPAVILTVLKKAKTDSGKIDRLLATRHQARTSDLHSGGHQCFSPASTWNQLGRTGPCVPAGGGGTDRSARDTERMAAGGAGRNS